MGTFLSREQDQRAKETRILMIGLDAAGKSNILERMRFGEVMSNIPKIGFYNDTVQTRVAEICSWDIGGRDKVRHLWRHYFDKTKAIVFVVDSNDLERFGGECSSVKDEFSRLLLEDELKHCHILIMANKQDLPGAMSVDKIASELALGELKKKRAPAQMHIVGTIATTGKGLNEAFDWVFSRITNV